MKPWPEIGIILTAIVIGVLAQELPPPPDPPPGPLTPEEMGLEPPDFPATYIWTNTVYVIPEDTVIRFQTRDDLMTNVWYDATIIRTKKQVGFYRIVIGH